MKIFILFLICSITFVSMSFAQMNTEINIVSSPTLTCSDPLKGTTILFVNGQENEDWEAEASLRHINEWINSLGLKNRIDKNGKVHFEYVYNPTMGKIGGEGGG